MTDDLEDRVGELEAMVEEFKRASRAAFQKAESAESELGEVREEQAALEEEVATLREEKATLEQELDEVRERTDLLQAVRNASSLDSEEQAAVCIQNLHNKALNNDDRAELPPSEGLTALGHSIDRTSIYDVYRRAERLVGDHDLLWYQSEPRNAEKNSRLILDLTKGSLPSTVAGYDIHAQEDCGTSTTRDPGVGGRESHPADD
jgi:regulator of replication initiation timing